MLTHLRWPRMAGEIPTGEGSVFHFLDIFALGCGLEACSALWSGKPSWEVVAGIIGAIAFHLIGTKWPTIRTSLWPSLSSRLESVGNNRRLRFAVLAVIVGYFLITGLLYIRKLRGDLDIYVEQRIVSKEQGQKLRDYLRNHDPYSVTVRVVPRDQEAINYAGQIFNALRQTNWDVQGIEYAKIPASSKPMLNDLDAGGKPLYRNIGDFLDARDAWLEIEIDRKISEQLYDGYGVSIFSEFTGQPTRPDKLHPTSEMKLEEAQGTLKAAMAYANIEVDSSGAGYSRSKEYLYILVLHKSKQVEADIPWRARLQNWIIRLLRS
jgi:hypothetical protein